MRKISAIAINTFREAIRNRIMYSLVFFALVMIVFSYFIGEISIGEKLKVIQDMGLSSMSIFGILISIFVGIGLVYKEMDKRTIYTIISKPIERYQFLFGKFLGLSLMLLVQVILMSLFFGIILYLSVGGVDPSLVKPVIFIYMELMVITAIAIFFSSFTTPFLSALFCLGFFIIGRSSTDLHEVAVKSKNIFLSVPAGIIKYFNLDFFNISGKVVHGVDIGWGWMSQGILYGLFLSSIFLLLAFLIFERKDFK